MRRARRRLSLAKRGGGRDHFGAGQGLAGKRLEMRGFGNERASARLADPERLLVQVRRVEADHAGERLAVGEARFGHHQFVGVAGRHLDVEAEHIVVADLQRGDAGLAAVACLETGYRAPPLAAGGAQRVQGGIIALGDIAALRRVDRGRRHQSARQQVDQGTVADQRRQQVGEQGRRRLDPRQPVVQPPRLVEAVAELA